MTPQEFTQFMTLLCGQTETPHEAAFYPHMAMSQPKMAYWYKELHSFPLAVCCTALERYYDTGEDDRLLGVGFLLTPCVMKPCAYLRHSLPPPAVGGFKPPLEAARRPPRLVPVAWARIPG